MTGSDRNPRVTVSFSFEEMGLIQARSNNDPAGYLKALALSDIGSDDPVCRQFYALGMTLNEALSVLIDVERSQVPSKLTRQLSVLHDAIKALQRQASLEQPMDSQTILQQLHEAVGGNKLAQIEPPTLTANTAALLRELWEAF